MKTRRRRTSPASGIHADCRFNQYSSAFSAPTPKCSRGGRLDWGLLAVWVFVVFCFAALVFAGHLIRVKCGSPRTF